MSRKNVIWTDRAKAELRAIDQQTAMRVLHSLARLTALGEGDVEQLQGSDPPQYRLRVGDYRVLFHYLDGGIHGAAVRHRREAYR
jgi:mRNA-degrading endonuclease RelE of RelBE toxin-antitoxin system